MREAALSLGVPQWKVTMQVLYRSALPGIVTGILLAMARISGETAPLLFTAFGNEFYQPDILRRDERAAAGDVQVRRQPATKPGNSWPGQARCWSPCSCCGISLLARGTPAAQQDLP